MKWLGLIIPWQWWGKSSTWLTVSNMNESSKTKNFNFFGCSVCCCEQVDHKNKLHKSDSLDASLSKGYDIHIIFESDANEHSSLYFLTHNQTCVPITHMQKQHHHELIALTDVSATLFLSSCPPAVTWGCDASNWQEKMPAPINPLAQNPPDLSNLWTLQRDTSKYSWWIKESKIYCSMPEI